MKNLRQKNALLLCATGDRQGSECVVFLDGEKKRLSWLPGGRGTPCPTRCGLKKSVEKRMRGVALAETMRPSHHRRVCRPSRVRLTSPGEELQHALGRDARRRLHVPWPPLGVP